MCHSYTATTTNNFSLAGVSVAEMIEMCGFQESKLACDTWCPPPPPPTPPPTFKQLLSLLCSIRHICGNWREWSSPVKKTTQPVVTSTVFC